MSEHTSLFVGICIGIALFVLLLSFLCCVMGWKGRDRQIRRAAAEAAAAAAAANAGGGAPAPAP